MRRHKAGAVGRKTRRKIRKRNYYLGSSGKNVEIGPPGNQVGGRADLVFRFKNGKTVRSAREYDTSDRVAGGTRYHD